MKKREYPVKGGSREKGPARAGWKPLLPAGEKCVLEQAGGKSLPGGGRYHPEELQSEVEPRPSTAFAGRKALSAGAFFFSRKKAGQEASASGPGKKGSVYFAN